MARRVLADIDSEVLLRLGNRTDITSTQRAFFIHDAYLRVSSAYDHIQLQGEGTETLALNADNLVNSSITDLWWPIEVKDNTSGFIIRPEDKEFIDNLTKYTSQPRKYYWFAAKFVFDCLSDQARTIYFKYKKKPAEITAGLSSVLDEVYDLCIILMAAKIGFETVRAFEEAAIMRNLYKQYEVDQGLIPAQQEELNDYRTGMRVRFR